jgi:hypothetical protein
MPLEMDSVRAGVFGRAFMNLWVSKHWFRFSIHRAELPLQSPEFLIVF